MMQEESTNLNLLARDAIVRVSFPAVLNAEQYAELLAMVKRAETARSIADEVAALGQRWNIKATAEPVKRGKAKGTN